MPDAFNQAARCRELAEFSHLKLTGVRKIRANHPESRGEPALKFDKKTEFGDARRPPNSHQALAENGPNLAEGGGGARPGPCSQGKAIIILPLPR